VHAALSCDAAVPLFCLLSYEKAVTKANKADSKDDHRLWWVWAKPKKNAKEKRAKQIFSTIADGW